MELTRGHEDDHRCNRTIKMTNLKKDSSGRRLLEGLTMRTRYQIGNRIPGAGQITPPCKYFYSLHVLNPWESRPDFSMQTVYYKGQIQSP
jgi:hypothetical protein